MSVTPRLRAGIYLKAKINHVVVLLQEGVGCLSPNKAKKQSNPPLQSTQITLSFMESLEYCWYVYIYYFISHNNLANYFSSPLYRWED